MNQLSLRCIKFAFAYLAIGISLGTTFALDRAIGASLRQLHAELNLWGWVTLLIYGMAYHMLPRFMGRPLRWSQVTEAQSWLAIGGVGLAACGWLCMTLALPPGRLLLAAGGILQLIAAMAFGGIITSLLWGKAMSPRGAETLRTTSR
jgi:hypothetical protein